MVLEAIERFQDGMEMAVRMITGLWGIRVVFRGAQAYTDGKTIVVPDVTFLARTALTDEDVEDAIAYLIALRGYVWHEVAHLMESDMDMPRSEAFGKEHGHVAHQLVNALEDIRIEFRFGRREIGIQEAIEYVRESWVWPRIAKRWREDDAAKKRYPSYIGEAMLAMQVVTKHGGTYEDHEIWEASPSESRSFVLRSMDLVHATRDAYDLAAPDGTQAIQAATVAEIERWRAEHALCAVLWTKADPVPPVLLATVVTDQRKYLKSLSKEDADKYLESLVKGGATERPVLAGTPVLSVVGVEVVKAAAATPGEPGDASTAIEDASNPAASVEGELTSRLRKLAPGTERTMVYANPPPDSSMDLAFASLMAVLRAISDAIREKAKQDLVDAEMEFNMLPADEQPYLVYTNENDIYVETPEGTPQELQRLRDRIDKYYGAIKARLQSMLRVLTRTKQRGGAEEGEELDDDSVADIGIAQFAPIELRPFMYETAESTLLSTVVGLLGDSSGSMQWGSQVSKIDLMRLTAVCFAECLSLAKIQFAMWAFTSNCDQTYELYEKASDEEKRLYGRFGGTYIETLKTFNQDWQAVQLRASRFGSESAANYDADSLWWAGKQLLAKDALRRVLYVFSDGMPIASDRPLQTARQQKHLRDVVLALRAANVEVVGVGIQDDSVVQFYTPQAVVVNTLSDLPSVTMRELENLLTKTKKRSR